MTMASLTQAANDIRALEVAVSSKMSVIDTRLNTAAQQVGSTGRTFYVDQANGDDAAAGTQLEPLASLEEAINRHTFGGQTSAILLSDYTVDTRVNLRFGAFQIVGQTGVEKLIFADGAQYVQADDGAIFSPHFYDNAFGTGLRIVDLELRLGSGGAANDHNFAFRSQFCSELNFQGVDFANISTSDQHLIHRANGLIFHTWNCTYDAAPEGRFVVGVAAGTDPLTERDIIYTNLTQL